MNTTDPTGEIPAPDVAAAVHRLHFEVTQPFAENEVPAAATARLVSNPFPVKGDFPLLTSTMAPPKGWQPFVVVLTDDQVAAIKGTTPTGGDYAAQAAWLVVAKQLGGLPE